MARLTEKDDRGNWGLKGCPWEMIYPGKQISQEIWERLYGALCKLKDYEDTQLSPEDVVRVNCFERSQSGKLLKLYNEEQRKHRWIPISEQLPEDDGYILLSFENFSIPCVGRYEEDENGGAFYVGDEGESCSSAGLFVNAWMPLPEPYKGE